MTHTQKLMEAEDQLDFALRGRNHEEARAIEAKLPALRAAAQEERSRERLRAILQPLKYAFRHEPQQ
jgi:hypothetical protein